MFIIYTIIVWVVLLIDRANEEKLYQTDAMLATEFLSNILIIIWIIWGIIKLLL